MVKLCIKLYASGVTSTDNVATTVIPIRANLVGVSWSINTINVGAVGSSTWYQLSTMSTSTWTNNDARGIVSEIMAGNDKAVNINGVQNWFIPIPGITFEPGDILRLHRYALVAPSTSISICNLLFV